MWVSFAAELQNRINDRSHSKYKECVQLALKTNCRGQHADASVSCRPFCLRLSPQHINNNDNNESAKFKQPWINLHILFGLQQKIVPSSSFAGRLIGLWSRVCLEGFSCAVTGEVQTLQRQQQHSHIVYLQQLLEVQDARRDNLEPPQAYCTTHEEAYPLSGVHHFLDDETFPDSWFLCWSYLA